MEWKRFVEVDPSYFRPAEVDYLLADPSKARRLLDWQPTVTFPELVRLMVEADCAEVDRQLAGGVAALRPEAAHA
jgi:GDPmannose 4,6-dehydratase